MEATPSARFFEERSRRFEKFQARFEKWDILYVKKFQMLIDPSSHSTTSNGVSMCHCIIEHALFLCGRSSCLSCHVNY